MPNLITWGVIPDLNTWGAIPSLNKGSVFFAICKISKIFLKRFLNAKYTINSLFATFYSKKQFWLNFARRKFSHYYFGKLPHVVKNAFQSMHVLK